MNDNEQHIDEYEWTIAESENFFLKGWWENAYLVRKSDGTRVVSVGDFYGNPEAGIIDINERFCVTVGCGVIVYRLIEPFEKYAYNTETAQWYEFGRDPQNIKWIEDVRQIGDDEIVITDEYGNEQVVKIIL